MFGAALVGLVLSLVLSVESRACSGISGSGALILVCRVFLLHACLRLSATVCDDLLGGIRNKKSSSLPEGLVIREYLLVSRETSPVATSVRQSKFFQEDGLI